MGCTVNRRRGGNLTRFLGLLLYAGSVCGSPTPGYGWGDTGHQIVALVAEQHLAPHTRSRLMEIMGPGGLDTIATWADHFRQGRASDHALIVEGERIVPEDTVPWHFVNIPIQRNDEPGHYAAHRHCPRGNCVVMQTERFRRILADPTRPLEERRTALKFLVHFVADLHQPLHCANRHRDRGGNRIVVVFMGERFVPGTRDSPWTLHGVWDSGLIAQTGLSAKAYADRVLAWLDTKDLGTLASGAPSDWANESHRAAARYAYAIPKHRHRRLGEEYLTRSQPVVEEMLAKAGVRLASMLNEALGL